MVITRTLPTRHSSKTHLRYILGDDELGFGGRDHVLRCHTRRAINQQEPGWEKTLTGEPKEMYEFWQKHLRPRGYKLKVQIVDFPDDLPGDIGMTLSWH